MVQQAIDFLVTALIVIAIVAPLLLIIPRVIKILPSDPPYITLRFTIFGRTNKVDGGIGGLRIRIPKFWDYILINTGKQEREISFTIPTKDDIFVTLYAFIAWIPDWQPGDGPDDHRLETFLNAAGFGSSLPSWDLGTLQAADKKRAEAIDKLLENEMKQGAKDWVGRRVYNSVKRDGSKKIMREVLPKFTQGSLEDDEELDRDVGEPDDLGLGIRITNFTFYDIAVPQDVQEQLAAKRKAEAEREADLITASAKSQQLLDYLHNLGYTDEQMRNFTLNDWNSVLDRLLAEKDKGTVDTKRFGADSGVISELAELIKSWRGGS